MDIVDASACWRIRTRCYSIPAISLPAASRNPRIHSRARRIQAAETTMGYLAQSAHDRSMSPSFPPSDGLLLGCTATTVRWSTPSPRYPCYPHHAVVCTARCELTRCSPFLRTPLSSPDSSPVPFVLLPPSRRKRERRRRNKRLEEVAKKEEDDEAEGVEAGKSGGKEKCLWTGQDAASVFLHRRFRRVFTPALLRPLLSSPLRFLEFPSFLFPRSFSLLRATFGLVSYVELVCSLRATRGRRAVTSVADFRLECSHLESVFSCTEPVDIFSQQTSSLSKFSAVFERVRNFSLVSFIGKCAQKLAKFGYLSLF